MYNLEEKDRLRRILILFLALSLLFSCLPLTISRAGSSDIELYYDRGGTSGGRGVTLPIGFAVLFTPPAGDYSLTKIKFFGEPFIPPPSGDLPFYVEIWDRDRNTLLNLTLRYGGFFNDVFPKWVVVDIQPISLNADFFVCIFPNWQSFSIGMENVFPASNRSYDVRMDDNSIVFGPSNELNMLIRAIMSPPPPPPPDLNSDGIVDILDALQLASAFGSNPNDTRWNPKADLNNDDIVDASDGLILCNNFGKTSIVQLEFQTISTWWTSATPAYYVIQNQSSFDEMWGNLTSLLIPPDPQPKIDFSTSTLIAVFMGMWVSTGYDIGIKEIRDLGQSVVVKVEKTYPGRNCFVNWQLTYPCHWVKIDKTDKPIIFETVEETTNCSQLLLTYSQ